MASIIKATEGDSQLLSGLAKKTFVESHGRSALAKDIDIYISEKYAEEILRQELSEKKNVYYIIYHDNRAAGYSKIILDASYADGNPATFTKLERLYLLHEFYDLKLGSALLNFNIEYSKKFGQTGMWLFVWTENQRAINFYKKHGFEAISRSDFRISATHSNPNFLMVLPYY